MKEKIVSIFENSIVKNSIKTFLQGFFGALAVTKEGAQSSLPTMEDVNNFRGE